MSAREDDLNELEHHSAPTGKTVDVRLLQPGDICDDGVCWSCGEEDCACGAERAEQEEA